MCNNCQAFLLNTHCTSDYVFLDNCEYPKRKSMEFAFLLHLKHNKATCKTCSVELSMPSLKEGLIQNDQCAYHWTQACLPLNSGVPQDENKLLFIKICIHVWQVKLKVEAVQRPWMDSARSVAHLSILNPGAPTGCTDNTLGGRLYQQSGKEVPFVCF